MAFVTNHSYDHKRVTLDLSRLRPVFQHLDPEVREQVARAIHAAYPDLLITALPNGMMHFEKV